MADTPEQKARDMIERMGIEEAQSLTSGDVVELANLLANVDRFKRDTVLWLFGLANVVRGFKMAIDAEQLDELAANINALLLTAEKLNV